jgi:predicted alpha/beta superfamily hydrolase
MPKHTLTGTIKRHRAFPSKILGNRRDVLVYLPPGYRRFSRNDYPVLYLQDGQNVFDAATAFAGVEWGVDETAERLIRKKLIEPLIIVAIANMGEDRIHEYAPTLGGLVTLAIGFLYPHAFSRLIVMSPSIWWDDFAIFRLVDSIEQKPSLKIWLDTGTAEPGWEQARELRSRLTEKSWRLHRDLQYMEADGADHSEAAWARRVEPALRFLFPSRP